MRKIGSIRWRVQRRSLRNAYLSSVLFCVLAATLGCRTPSPDWDGTWKLNPSKSNFQGPIITVSISTDGEYRLDTGRSTFTFRCDEKDRPIAKNRTRTCVKVNNSVLDLIRKENGVKTDVSHWELSENGKVLTATDTAYYPTGPVIVAQIVSSRMSGSDDFFAGRWRDTSYLQRYGEMTVRLDAQTLHIGYPSAGQYVDIPLNGVDAAVYGPHSSEGLTCATQLVRRRKLLLLKKHNGEVLTENSLELSSDGRIITESWWNPDRPTDKGKFVYEKK